jgi:TatD DNase family protein
MNDLRLETRGLVDFHCHLDLYPNHLQLIEECEQLGIKTLSVTNAPSVWPRNQELVKRCRHVRVALGLHPQLAQQREHEIILFENYLNLTRYVGEVGLDGSPEYLNSWKIQQKVFQRILELCAKSEGKILTVHSRRAAREVLQMVGTYLPRGKGKVVLHWFTGTKQEAQLAVSMGCYFSINYRMIESEQRRKLIETLPQERILTESDGPFIKIDNESSVPRDTAKVITGLASLWGMGDLDAVAVIRKNLAILLS